MSITSCMFLISCGGIYILVFVASRLTQRPYCILLIHVWHARPPWHLVNRAWKAVASPRGRLMIASASIYVLPFSGDVVVLPGTHNAQW